MQHPANAKRHSQRTWQRTKDICSVVMGMPRRSRTSRRTRMYSKCVSSRAATTRLRSQSACVLRSLAVRQGRSDWYLCQCHIHRHSPLLVRAGRCRSPHRVEQRVRRWLTASSTATTRVTRRCSSMCRVVRNRATLSLLLTRIWPPEMHLHSVRTP